MAAVIPRAVAAPGAAATGPDVSWGATADEAREKTAAAFISGLRNAMAAISFVVLLSGGVFRHLDVYHPLWPQLAAYCALLAITGTEAVLNLRHRSWGWARWIAVGVALAASVASCLSLPADAATRSADWAFGAVGWSGVMVLADQPLAMLVAFLGAHEAITAINLLAGGPDLDTVLSFLAGSIGTIGFPLACGIAATALQRAAATAETARAETERIREQEQRAAARARVRQERYLELSRTAGPLLRGLADGTLDPRDPAVKRDCWIEATRMRRLFAEADEVANRLVHELDHLVEGAIRKGVRAELRVSGEVPQTPVEIRRAFAEITLGTLAIATSTARLTLISIGGEVSLNLLCDVSADWAAQYAQLPISRVSRLAAGGQPIEVEQPVENEGTLWVEARWQAEL
jgi:hypothetical protein